MWTTLEAVHVKHCPGAQFNAYNSLFSLPKNDDETLSSLASRVEESMCTVQNLCPKSFTLSELNDELQSMALIRALPDVYNAFINALLLKDKLNKATILNARRFPEPRDKSLPGRQNVTPIVHTNGESWYDQITQV